jgi:hypothetical protein
MSIELALMPIAIWAIANRKKPQQFAGNLVHAPIHRETRMTDSALFQLAWQNWGCRSVMSGVTGDSAPESAQIVFESAEGSTFIAVFAGDISIAKADECLCTMFTEYTRRAQHQVYQN